MSSSSSSSLAFGPEWMRPKATEPTIVPNGVGSASVLSHKSPWNGNAASNLVSRGSGAHSGFHGGSGNSSSSYRQNQGSGSTFGGGSSHGKVAFTKSGAARMTHKDRSSSSSRFIGRNNSHGTTNSGSSSYGRRGNNSFVSMKPSNSGSPQTLDLSSIADDLGELSKNSSSGTGTNKKYTINELVDIYKEMKEGGQLDNADAGGLGEKLRRELSLIDDTKLNDGHMNYNTFSSRKPNKSRFSNTSFDSDSNRRSVNLSSGAETTEDGAEMLSPNLRTGERDRSLLSNLTVNISSSFSDFGGNTGGILDIPNSLQSSPSVWAPSPLGQQLHHSSQTNVAHPSSSNTPFFPPGITPPPTHTQSPPVPPAYIQWYYLDPQGNEQGPFPGPLMQEWYAMSYFSPDLQLRRAHDPTFIRLDRLINILREVSQPFLVPLPGTSLIGSHFSTPFFSGMSSSATMSPPVRSQTATPTQGFQSPSIYPPWNMSGSEGPSVPLGTNPLSGVDHTPNIADPGWGSVTSGVSGDQTLNSVSEQIAQLALSDPHSDSQSIPSTIVNESNLEVQQPSGASPDTSQVKGDIFSEVLQTVGSDQLEADKGDSSESKNAFPSETDSNTAHTTTEEVDVSSTSATKKEVAQDSADQYLAESETASNVVSDSKDKTTAGKADIETEESQISSEQSEQPDKKDEGDLATASGPSKPDVTPVAPWANITKERSTTPLTLSRDGSVEPDDKSADRSAEKLKSKSKIKAVPSPSAPSLKKKQKKKSFVPLPTEYLDPDFAEPTNSQQVNSVSAAPSVTDTPISSIAPWAVKPPTTEKPTKSFAEIRKEELEAAAARKKNHAMSLADVVSATTSKFPEPKSKADEDDSADWITVGSNAKHTKPAEKVTVKQSVPPSAAVTPSVPKTVSATPAATSRPVVSQKSEFASWIETSFSELKPSVNKGELISIFAMLPPNSQDTFDIIADSIYANSTTLDGRRFASEFIRRRKAVGLADIESLFSTVSRNSASKAKGKEDSWSEVVAKGSKKAASETDDDGWSGFKVVYRKKGKK